MTVTGMAIVFSALIGISVFIALLPRVLAALRPLFPEKTPCVEIVEDDPGVEALQQAAAAAYAIHLQAVEGRG